MSSSLRSASAPSPRSTAANPYIFRADGREYRVDYVPGEGNTHLFGGNSNWRGPVWFPINYLIVEALERYYHFYGDDLKVECPTGSGVLMNLQQVANEIVRRLIGLFLPNDQGSRPCHGQDCVTPLIRTGKTWSCSTNIFMAKPGAVAAPPIKPAGQESSDA